MTIHNDYKLPKLFNLHWYTIQSVLGSGGFGITYLAKDNNLHSEVAIKEFYPRNYVVRGENYTVIPESKDKKSIYEWGLKRFLEEAQTLARFKHRNIVSINSVFQANHSAYIVMEYIRGINLKELIKQGQKFSENEIRSLVQDISDGLQLVHEAGFIHRDIKPGNILLKDATTPVLIDFGSARLAIGTKTQQLTTLISVGYAPSEQYDLSGDSEKQGPWTDIYALGATTYELMTGDTPVDAITRINCVMQGKQDPVLIQLNKYVNQFSEELIQAVSSALLLNPNDRPQSLPDWWRILDNGIDKSLDETIEASQSNRLLHQALSSGDKQTTGSLPKKKKKHASIAPLIAAISVVAISIAIYLSWNLFQDKKEADPEKIISSSADIVASDANKKASVTDIGDEYLAWENELRQLKIKNHYFEPQHDNVMLQLKTARADYLPEFSKSVFFKELQKAIVNNVSDSIAREEYQLAENKISSIDDIQLLKPLAGPLRSEMHIATKQQNENVNTLAEKATIEPSNPNQQTIDILLAQAKQDMDHFRLTTPKNKNAYFSYQRVLELDASNQMAKAGITQIADKYALLVERKLTQNDLSSAQKYLDKIKMVSANHDLISTLQQKIEANKISEARIRQETQRKNELIKIAQAQMEKGHLYFPFRNSAYNYFSQVLQSDPTNSTAKKSMVRMESNYRASIQQDIANKKYHIASQKIKQVEEIPGFTQRFANLSQELNEKNKADQQQLAQRKKQIEIQKWLDTADNRISAKQYVEPADSSALSALRKAIKLDPENEKAGKTLLRLQSLLLNEANQALSKDDLETARVKLKKASFQELANSQELMRIKADIETKERQPKPPSRPQASEFDFLPPP